MTKPGSKCESRPVIVPKCFSCEECFEDWIDQFENITEINHWDDGQKLIWFKVCLTGTALMVYKKFPTTARGNFKKAVRALLQ